MRRFFRWPALVVLALLLLVGIIPTWFFVAQHRSLAHAAGTQATISLPTIVHPYDTVTITLQGFNPYSYVSLAVDARYQFTSVTCDANGNSTANVSLPSGITQGQHQIVANGTGGIIAQQSVTFEPGFTLNTLAPGGYSYSPTISGGPGTTLTILGSSFALGETVNVFWGPNQSVAEGNATADAYSGSINYSFTIPTTATPGWYPVTIVRTNQTPAKVSQLFRVLPPHMTSTAGVRANQPVQVNIHGFQGGEQIALSWNANGGQTITTLTTDITGQTEGFIMLPTAPKGAYMLTATGVTSALKATSKINIGPGIMLTSNTSNPGGSIQVNGGGYTPGESVNVYFQTQSNGVTIASVDQTGAFSVMLTAPTTYNKNTNYYVHAVSTTGTEASATPFFFATPSTNVPNSSVYGQSFTVTGQDFTANETVTIVSQYPGQKTPVVLGTTQAQSDGSFSFTTTLGSVPYTPSSYPVFGATLQIGARGKLSKQLIWQTMREYAASIATPATAIVGEKVLLKGGGYAAGEVVSVSGFGQQLGSTTTLANGSFSLTITVPPNASSNNYYGMQVVGSTSNITTKPPLTILPSIQITPKKGASGTKITISGKGFNGGGITITISWYDPVTAQQSQLTTLITQGTTFSIAVNAPANLVQGRTYEIQATGYGQPTAQAMFTAQ